MLKTTEIEAKEIPNERCVRLAFRTTPGNPSTFVYISASTVEIATQVRTPHAARELAQQLRGAAEALVDWALVQEQPANFTTAEVKA